MVHSIAEARATGGLFIPLEVWEDPRLTLRQKLLYAEIAARGDADTHRRRLKLVELFAAPWYVLSLDLRALLSYGYAPEDES